MVEFCIKNKKKPKIVFASSYNLTRTLKVSPPSIWSLHKYFGEQYLGYFREYFEANTIVVRIGNVYGVPVNSKKIFNSSINKIHNTAKNGSITLYKNSNLLRSFVHVEDLVRCLFAFHNFPEFKLPSLCYASELQLCNYEEIAQILIQNLESKGRDVKLINNNDELSRIEMYADKDQSPNIFNMLAINPKWSVKKYLCNHLL